ncbi:hypothetical protein [Streptomyces sp. NPDC058694]|uniref:hypothetical protein n=1 Tax=Streptomyces sp. NPDC058694 TaxID=3346603 RepID=UPI0036697759
MPEQYGCWVLSERRDQGILAFSARALMRVRRYDSMPVSMVELLKALHARRERVGRARLYPELRELLIEIGPHYHVPPLEHEHDAFVSFGRLKSAGLPMG